jgi:hypothetical protein
MCGASQAFVVHRTATRIRLKIPDRQGQKSYFAALQCALRQHPDVLGVYVNPLAASVVIDCRDGLAFVRQNYRFASLELLPAQVHDCGGNAAAPGPDGNHSTRNTSSCLVEPLMKLLIALATKQVGAQLVEWAVAAIVQGATPLMPTPQRPTPPPMLLVSLGE